MEIVHGLGFYQETEAGWGRTGERPRAVQTAGGCRELVQVLAMESSGKTRKHHGTSWVTLGDQGQGSFPKGPAFKVEWIRSLVLVGS